MYVRHEEAVKDTEGHRIGVYKVREDCKGLWIKRHGMRGCVSLREQVIGDVAKVTWYQIDFYTDLE